MTCPIGSASRKKAPPLMCARIYPSMSRCADVVVGHLSHTFSIINLFPSQQFAERTVFAPNNVQRRHAHVFNADIASSCHKRGARGVFLSPLRQRSFLGPLPQNLQHNERTDALPIPSGHVASAWTLLPEYQAYFWAQEMVVWFLGDERKYLVLLVTRKRQPRQQNHRFH